MSTSMGTAAEQVRRMTVEQVHTWARGLPGLPRGDADAFAGQCFLEDVDGAALLAQTRESLCSELGVAQQQVHTVEAAIESLRQEGVRPLFNDPVATPRSLRDSFHDLMVSEGVPPTSTRLSATRTPVSTPDFVLQVERSLSALQDRHSGVVQLEKRLSQEALDSAQREREASAAAAEAVRLDLQEHSEARQQVEQRAAAAEREVRQVRQKSQESQEALLAAAEDRHAIREAELVARIDELMARVATETEARTKAEESRDELEGELQLAHAMGEAAEEQLAAELLRAREERAATKIQMIWRVYRVSKVALADSLSHRALLLEVESARVAAAVKNVQIQVRARTI